MPRPLPKAHSDPAGLKTDGDLPYNLRPKDAFRLIEDIHDLLHDVNSMMVEREFGRMEELLDPAGFSGFISRTVADRLEGLTRTLVKNRHHNGYPDLLPRGVYPSNATPHGTEGGLEVKATRSAMSWQAHGPRAGWFCLVQFSIDVDEEKPLADREPTRVLAVMVAELEKEDWSWQPAKTGRIRSGTASVKPSGTAKLRANAVWVDPGYQAEHDTRLFDGRRAAWRKGAPEEDLIEILEDAGGPLHWSEIAERVATEIDVPAEKLSSTTQTVLRRMAGAGSVRKPRPGWYER